MIDVTDFHTSPTPHFETFNCLWYIARGVRISALYRAVSQM